MSRQEWLEQRASVAKNKNIRTRDVVDLIFVFATMASGFVIVGALFWKILP